MRWLHNTVLQQHEMMPGCKKFQNKKVLKKSPAFAVWINLIPGRNQVGAIEESLGVPVVSGHAHPFPGIAPFIFYSRGTSFINHEQSRGRCSIHFLFIIYQNQEKMARKKYEGFVPQFFYLYVITRRYTLSSAQIYSKSTRPSRCLTDFPEHVQ